MRPGSVAEEVGFEPTEGVNPRRFSRPVHSTTLPLLRHALPNATESAVQVERVADFRHPVHGGLSIKPGTGYTPLN